MRNLLVLTLFFATQSSGLVNAQSNYYPYPLGIRTAGMGGAAAAFGQDSAITWVNPAGLAFGSKTSIALTANALLSNSLFIEKYSAFDESLVSELNYPEDESRFDLQGSGLHTFPSSFAYMTPISDDGSHMFALSLHSPISQEQSSFSRVLFDPVPGLNVFKIDEETTSYHRYEFGPSYAFRVGDKFRFGASAFLQYTQGLRITKYELANYDLTVPDISFGPTQTRDRFLHVALDFVAGVQLGPFGGFSLGAAIHAPSQRLYGSFRRDSRQYQGSGSMASGVTAGIRNLYVNSDTYTNVMPMWLTVGLGYEKSRVFAIALDVNHYSAVEKYAYLDAEIEETRLVHGQESSTMILDGLFEEERNSVTNFNFGVEWFLNTRAALRFGVFTDFNNSLGLPAESERQLADRGRIVFDRYGASIGLGYSSSNTQFQLGGIYRRSVGTAIGLDLPSGALPDRPLQGNMFMLVFSGEMDPGVIGQTLQSAVIEEISQAEGAEVPHLRSSTEAQSPSPATSQASADYGASKNAVTEAFNTQPMRLQDVSVHVKPSATEKQVAQSVVVAPRPKNAGLNPASAEATRVDKAPLPKPLISIPANAASPSAAETSTLQAAQPTESRTVAGLKVMVLAQKQARESNAKALFDKLLQSLNGELTVSRWESGQKIRPNAGPEAIAKGCQTQDVDYTLVLNVTKKGWKFTGHAQLVECSSGKIVMDYRSDYFKPEIEAQDRGDRIAKTTLRKLSELLQL